MAEVAGELPCQEWDPELWFPEKGSGCRPGTIRHADYRFTVDLAKSVCARCHLRSECLERGLDEPFGIWGGLDESERRRLRAQRARGVAA